ncbi:MAG TPA: hypothetical protein VN026_16205, partial [Bacteroidia bacterium]|nr:hypothetical protein [Bacteroidia bacterium]
MTAIRNIIFLILFSLVCKAQTDSLSLAGMNAKDLKKLGINAILQEDPNSAVIFLERSVQLNNKDYDAQGLLAEAYRLVRNYEAAEKTYALVYKGDPKKYPEALFYVAEMQKSNGDYDKAKESYTLFKKEYKGSDRDMKKNALREIDFCDSAKNLVSKEKKIIIQHLEGDVNKINVEASPLSLDENTMMYSSLRTDKKEFVVVGDTNNTVVRKMYLAKKVNNEWQFSGEMDGPFNASGYNVGNATMTPDGKRMYFTRCKPNWQGKMICAIFVTEKKGEEWSEPEKLDKKINDPKYTNTQPAVSIDPVKGNEVVYFISNNKEGKGGLDIWYFIYDPKTR